GLRQLPARHPLRGNTLGGGQPDPRGRNPGGRRCPEGPRTERRVVLRGAVGPGVLGARRPGGPERADPDSAPPVRQAVGDPLLPVRLDLHDEAPPRVLPGHRPPEVTHVAPLPRPVAELPSPIAPPQRLADWLRGSRLYCQGLPPG